jgi:hypothetical protein
MDNNKIAVGARVEDTENTSKGPGTVLGVSERKASVKWDSDAEGTEPESIFKKYLVVVKAATKTAAKKAEKVAKPKKERVPKTDHVVPLFRKDGEESKSITRGADLSHYQLHTDVKTPSGRPTLDVGDKVAEEVIKVTAHELSRLTGETITQSSIRAKYEYLNPGQIRMNCGNRLRAAFKADEAGA